jgi:hypothetical protein
MYKYKRRILLRTISTAAVASVASIPLSLFGQAPAKKVDPKEPQAVSLGYTEDTTKVDKKKFPKHDPSQRCDNCQFYMSAQEANGYAPCSIFGNRPVAAKGWCSAWVKKTA